MADATGSYLEAMIELSERVPEVPVQSSIYGLAALLPRIEEKLDTDDAKELVRLGAFLWRKSLALGEVALDVYATSSDRGGEISRFHALADRD